MSEESCLNSSGNKANDANDVSTLSELFDKAFELFNEINKTQESTNSPKIQSDVRRTMNMLEDATRLVSLVDMFSKNERFEEVAAENIKYFLLPAFLGTLATKITDTENRMHILDVAEIYFIDFLKRVKAYGLTDIDIPDNKSDDNANPSSERNKSNAEMITEMVSQRNTKVQRYREQKELESRLDTMKQNLTNPNIDDDVKRDYFVTLIKLYISLAIDELSSLATEKSILEHMKKMGKTETANAHTSQKQKVPAPKLKPIIITRDQLQKTVYGAGYPSLPVLTVDEFYEQRVKDGDWPDASKRNQVGSKCLQDMAKTDESGGNEEDPEDIEKEKRIEVDDQDLLKQMRAMDEYKDTHRRGWGNRANRS